MGNGFPVGAMLATDKVASAFVPGSHASTFGGNPLGMAAGLAVMKTLFEDGIMENCKKVGSYMIERLNGLKKNHAVIQDVRGKGLMIGVELNIPGSNIVARALKKGVLMNCTCINVLRFLPPLIVTTEDVDKVIEVLDEVMEN
jgi:acetylornithine/succinyldiaminopimelate/putrescine aminotransferase